MRPLLARGLADHSGGATSASSGFGVGSFAGNGRPLGLPLRIRKFVGVLRGPVSPSSTSHRSEPCITRSPWPRPLHDWPLGSGASNACPRPTGCGDHSHSKNGPKERQCSFHPLNCHPACSAARATRATSPLRTRPTPDAGTNAFTVGDASRSAPRCRLQQQKRRSASNPHDGATDIRTNHDGPDVSRFAYRANAPVTRHQPRPHPRPTPVKPAIASP
jgi:hypothetical protein